MPFTIRQIVNPSTAELEAVSKVLAIAFAEDEFTAIVLGRNPVLVYDFCYAQVVAAKLAGEIFVAESTVTKELIGAALWFGPGREMFDSEDQNEQALLPLVAKLDPDLQQWWSEVFIPRYDEVVLEALGAGVKKASWHLQLIGTIPAERRKGVARALINEVRNKVGGILLCLEAEEEVNVRSVVLSSSFFVVLEQILMIYGFMIKVGIYEKIGFKVRGEKQVFTGAHGSFPMWVMARE
ncbi:hypothetical protein Hypma_006557 [Hypsizygus marmoreus]|uniref:N-acetyltransferase domain-containing protein n=1 Tax=Hypsizygus marmoreus TaxID=39966 RepID=A0A369K1T5_HYPMA|nr:hypothetical protein Hypma_006557 [Hypsizygus marmoreus]